MYTKTCKNCKLDFPLKSYAKNVATKDQLMSICRECSNEKSRAYRENNKEKVAAHYTAYFLNQRYGLSVAQLHSMISAQNGLCAICNLEDPKKRLSVDHDHKTGKVRGLLCNSCNLGIGKLKDSVGVLQAALTYLKKHKAS